MRLRTGVALATLLAWLARGAERGGEAVRGSAPDGSARTGAAVELERGREPEIRRESAAEASAPAEQAAAGAEADAAEALEVPGGRVRLRLVDERTGEAVPHLDVSVGKARRSESLRTDAEGWLATAGAFQPGAVQLRVMERDETARTLTSVEVAHQPRAGSDGDVAIRIGPTYRLALGRAAAIELETLRAVLESETPQRGLFGPSSRRSPVRDGTPPWVRFARPTFFADPPPPWRLTVRSADAEWSGSARVDSIVGIRAEPVEIRLERRGWIEGQLVRPRFWEGAAFLELQGPADAGGAGPPHEHVPESGDRYRIGWLAPGEYRLRAYAKDSDLPWVPVTVLTGVGTQLDLTLRKRPVGGALAGVIEAFDRDAASGLRVSLTPEVEKHMTRMCDVKWDEARGLATWRFDDLPAGVYDVRVFGIRTKPVRPLRITASPPDETLVFRVVSAQDGARTVRLRPIDAETRACIAGPELWVRSPGDAHGHGTYTTGCGVPITGFLPGEPYEWVLRCSGYASAWGTHNDLPSEGAGELEVDVPLARGWNARFRVVDPSGAPVVGAELSAAGATPVATDATGCAVLAAPAHPGRVALAFGDWRIASGDLRPDGAFASDGYSVEVVLAPPAK